MKLVINITQDDIVMGRIKDCFNCPIARAALKAFRENNISVAAGLIYVTIDNIYYENAQYEYQNPIPLPEIAREFIIAFDHHMAVKPFSFEVEIPT